MSKTTTPTDSTAVVTTQFRRMHNRPGLILDTPWGPATITPHKSKWFVFAMVKGTANGQICRTLTMAMTSAMRMKSITSTQLLRQVKNRTLIGY